MQVRLLDMGMVNILRSQSIYHAIASSMVDESDPVVIILRPETSYFSINKLPEMNKEKKADFYQNNQLPVIQREIAEGDFFHNQNQLFLSFLFTENQSKKLGFNEGKNKKVEQLVKAVLLAYNKLGVAVEFNSYSRFQVKLREIGIAYLGRYKEVFSFFCSVNLDQAPITKPDFLTKPSDKLSFTSIREEVGKVPSLEGGAEALLSSFEELFNIALIPSMPMPEEMDLIYEWDNKLIINENLDIRNKQKLSGSLN